MELHVNFKKISMRLTNRGHSYRRDDADKFPIVVVDANNKETNSHKHLQIIPWVNVAKSNLNEGENDSRSIASKE